MVIVLAIVAMPITAVLPAAAAPVSQASLTPLPHPPSLASFGKTQHLATAVIPDGHPSAYNERTLFLTNSPIPGMAYACTSRPIYLAAGSYFWTYRWDGSDVTQGSWGLIIRTGTYTWEDCLYPEDGYYVQAAALENPSNSQIVYSIPEIDNLLSIAVTTPSARSCTRNSEPAHAVSGFTGLDGR
jgi:hypothetical protein